MLTLEKVKTLCKFGQGKDCCSFLMIGPAGWQCAKGTKFESVLLGRHLAKKMAALGNNYEGPLGEFKLL